MSITTDADTDSHVGATRPSVASRVPFTGLAGARLAPLRHSYVIAGIGALGALVLTATMVGRESVAVVAVGGSVVFLLALWRISAVTLALIPVTVLSSEPLHKTLPATILVAVLAFTAVVLFCVGSLRFRPPHLYVAMLGIMVLLGYFLPTYQMTTARQTASALVSMLAGLAALTICIASPPSTRAVLRVTLATGTIVGVLTIVQGAYVEGRLEGFGLNPNFLAVYLSAPIVIAIGLALHHRNPVWLAPGAACVPALLASQSREGFLATIIGTVILVIQGRPRMQKVLIILGAAAVLVAFPEHLNGLANLGAGTRPISELTANNHIRTLVALFAAHVALSHPLLGIGFGQFPAFAAATSGLGVYITTTNEYLLLASETGLIALTAFLVMLWRALRQPSQGDLTLVRAVVVTFAVSMLFIDSFGSSLVALPFWVCLGVLLAFRPDQSGTSQLPGHARPLSERSSADDD